MRWLILTIDLEAVGEECAKYLRKNHQNKELPSSAWVEGILDSSYLFLLSSKKGFAFIFSINLTWISLWNCCVLWAPWDHADADKNKAGPNVRKCLYHVRNTTCNVLVEVSHIVNLIIDWREDSLWIYKLRWNLWEDEWSKSIPTQDNSSDETSAFGEVLPAADQSDKVAHAASKSVHSTVQSEVLSEISCVAW